MVRLGNKSLRLRQLQQRGYATAVDPHLDHSNEIHARDARVKIVEVGPRDGLQNEKKAISLTTKIELIERLARSGLTDIEAGSFVAPKWVPQVRQYIINESTVANCSKMADSAEILEYILKRPPQSRNQIAYSFLAPNSRGLGDALDILKRYPTSYETFSPDSDSTYKREGATSDQSANSSSSSNPYIEMSIFPAATETFTQKNLNCSIETSLLRFKEVIQGAKANGMRVRAYISVVLGCPFEGDVDPTKVAEIATDLLEMGADEIDLGDTTGMGTGPTTKNLLRHMQAAGIRNEDIAMHFHDTYGQALVNTAVSLEHGIRTFDSSVGGLGGCPYSPGATGNVATEDMAYFLDSLGMNTGLDLEALAEIGEWITKEIGKPHESSVGKALLAKRRKTL